MYGKEKILAGAIALLTASTLGAAANEKVTFGTNWLAEPEHGGYYQAIADGTYAACGLDVTIMQGGFMPNQFLLADNGWETYATTIEVMQDTIDKRPEVVQCFVDGSAKGWYNYLYGNNKTANEMIKKDNPDMTDEQIAFSIEQLKKFGIVDSGDSEKLGIGAMTDARVQSFYDKMVKAKVAQPGIDIKKAYTLAFINKGVGRELKK